MSPTLRKRLIILAVIVLILGGFYAWIAHGVPAKHSVDEVSGKRPLLVEAQVETIPSVSLLRSVGWAAGEKPVAAKGLEVNRFAEGLSHPRTMLTLPNGDVVVAETDAPPSANPGGITGFFMKLFMSRVGAGNPSPDTLVLLRDGDGNGTAEQRFVLRKGDGLVSPSGLAWAGDKLYVANHDAVLAFDYKPGETVLVGQPKKVMDLPGGGNHWMRNLSLSPDGKYLYVAVGSSSNIGENGMDAEKGRAAIWEIDLAKGSRRQYAGGLRNPNGMAWNPASGELWTVVNERDMLGPDLVPDYLTNVPVGAQYGWPWVYWKDQMDWRVDAPIPDFLTEYTRKPEYALGPHVAALGLTFVTGGQRMGPDFVNGAFIARHGSWNRKPASGYDVVFIRFDDHGNPLGLPQPVLTGFLTGSGETHGRPTWLAWDKSGALLVSDDTAGIVWRVTAPGAQPAAAIKPVVTAHMPPRRQIDSPDAAGFGADEKATEQVGGVH
ncbi:MAG: sorbosone dehydrogenase family protein [Sphingomonadales bacterium]|nr:sorbosone dehydrogenase family protein [Sphingomonadales bacterium]